MTTHIARNDALIIRQVGTLSPVADNSRSYGIKINSKASSIYPSDGSATIAEITAGVVAILGAYSSATFPEASELAWVDSTTLITVTGPSTGKPFTLVDNSSGGIAALTVATTTTAKSPNHWIAENFSTGSLPANNDTVIITGLSTTQSFKWGLDQSAVTLTALESRADSSAQIGLPTKDADLGYNQANYKDLFLEVNVGTLKIGDGNGTGSSLIRINLLAATDCEATIYKTGSPASTDEGAVQLLGGTASSSIQILAGKVDLAMYPGSTGSWGTIVASGGTTRCGTGCTLATVQASGGAIIETRTAVVTLTVGESSTVKHIGGGINITTANIQGALQVTATTALTIATLNGYGGGSLDLSRSDSNVTVTNMVIYATPGNQFTINDPNNKLVMTNAASTPNGVQSLVVNTGSGKNLRIT